MYLSNYLLFQLIRHVTCLFKSITNYFYLLPLLLLVTFFKFYKACLGFTDDLIIIYFDILIKLSLFFIFVTRVSIYLKLNTNFSTLVEYLQVYLFCYYSILEVQFFKTVFIRKLKGFIYLESWVYVWKWFSYRGLDTKKGFNFSIVTWVPIQSSFKLVQTARYLEYCRLNDL